MPALSPRLRADLSLFLVAIIWGTAFVVQRIAAQNMGVFLFNGSRFLLGALVLLPFIARRRPANEGSTAGRQWIADHRFTINRHDLPLVGLAGCLLFGGSALQQAGLRYTTAGNAGFITGLYVVFVPLILMIGMRQRLRPLSWIAALLAAIGIFLLSAQGQLHLALGDALELAGSVLWALHVILVSRLVQRMDVLQFAAGQFFICGVLNLLIGLVVERAFVRELGGWMAGGWVGIVYTGVISVGVGYTLQAMGQKHSPPTDATLILSMEAVFAALGGWLWLGEALSTLQLLGCALILAAILLSQLSPHSTG